MELGTEGLGEALLVKRLEQVKRRRINPIDEQKDTEKYLLDLKNQLLEKETSRLVLQRLKSQSIDERNFSDLRDELFKLKDFNAMIFVVEMLSKSVRSLDAVDLRDSVLKVTHIFFDKIERSIPSKCCGCCRVM